MRPVQTKLNTILFAFLLLLQWNGALAQNEQYPPIDKVRADFKALLDRPKVPFNASFQTTKTDSVIIERGSFYSEANEKVPTLIYKPVTGARNYPVVIF